MKRLREWLQIAGANINNRKLRTSLTVLGIIISITTIYALLSIGNGLNSSIEEQFEKIGTNRLYITSSSSSVTSLQAGLTNEDVETLEALPEFRWVTPYFYERATIEYKKETERVTVWGSLAEDMEERWAELDFYVEKGRFLNEKEKFSAVLGNKVASDVFGRDIRVNEIIRINDKRFKVVGILEEIGNPEDDTAIHISIDTAQDIFDKKEQVAIIELVLKEGVDIQEIAKKTTRTLEKKRGDDLFEVTTPDQLLEQFTSVMNIVNTLLIAIAGISLIVGGIGIMNASYTAVLERRKEIGIMKAIGAENKDILFLFLIEAGITGLIGGGLGVICGYGIAKLAEAAAKVSGFSFLNIKPDPVLIIGSMSFALFVGIIAGILPAREATRKQAVEALRGK